MAGKLLIVLHNVYSVYRVVETARVVFSLGFKTLVVSKASGAAAHEGVPEAQKLAIRKKCNLFYVSDLPDVIELFSPDTVYILIHPPYAEKELNVAEVAEKVAAGKTVAFVIGGSEPGLTKKEMEIGEPVYLTGLEGDIGPVATTAILLYELKKHIKK